MKKVICAVLLCLCFTVQAQDKRTDSLLRVIKNTKVKDSLTIKNYLGVAGAIVRTDPGKALLYMDTVLTLSKKLSYKKGFAYAYHYRAMIFQNQGKLTDAIDNLVKANKIYVELKDLNNQSTILSNMGNLYYMTNQFDKAMEFYHKAYSIQEKGKNVNAMATSLNNMASVIATQKNYDSAYAMYKKALELRKQIGDSIGIASTLLSIGQIFEMTNDDNKAVEYYKNALDICERTRNYQREITALNVLSAFYLRYNKYPEALVYARRTAELAKQLQSLTGQREAAQQLYSIYYKTGNFKKSLDSYLEYIHLRDSIYNTDNARKLAESQMKYEFELQTAADSVRNAEEKKREDLKHEQAIHRQKMYTYGGIIGFALMLLVSIISFRAYRQKQKSNRLIEEQKKIVEEKQKEIVDSINYAKRLQSAIIPPEEKVKEEFPDSFVLFKPKDIVSGDFYWMEKLSNGLIILAVADCTGHGVPGAMVSVVGANSLNRCVKEFGLNTPASILDKLRELIIATFELANHEVKDGMDISLLVMDKNSGKLQWAGANNPLWILRNGATEIEEIKADKQPIGKFDHQQPFQHHELSVKKGDCLYLFSDGYAHQFGGEKGKKLKTSSMKELFVSMRSEKMMHQKQVMEKSFETWRGSLEQIDDVCVIGVRM